MRRSTFLCLVILATRLFGATDGLSLLADHTLSGWRGATDAVRLKDGVLHWQPDKGGTLYWHEELTDFTVSFEFRLPAGGNNGIAIRYPGHGDPAYSGLCEIQLLDDTAAKYAKLDPRQYTGSAYGMVAAQRGHLKPAGEWNRMRVVVRGTALCVQLNDAVILETDLSTIDQTRVLDKKPHPGLKLTKGYLGFAGHNSPIAFRHLVLTKLPP